ncbi:MAG: alpha/beta hydrolase [Chloroflexi bacterium]|nr:alpha/beta hydrolase [Chloroflexota bacterium]
MQIPFLDVGGDGPILHFAHPNAYPPECFRQFLAPLSEQYHVFAGIQRPLWANQKPEELADWQVLVDDMICLFEQQGWQNVIGVGHSLGAAVTMLTAVRHPEFFSKLALLDPVFLAPSLLQAAAQIPDAATQNPYVQGALNRRNLWTDKKAAFTHYRRKRVFNRWSDAALWDYVNNAIVPDGSGDVTLRYKREWEARFYSLLLQQGGAVWEALPDVRQPTLAVRALETDTLIPEGWQLWQELQPGATFIEAPDVSHLLIMERPLAMAQLVLDWLAEG